MTRNFTANRPRLNLRERVRVEIGDDNYLYVGPVKVAQWLPETETLLFKTMRGDRAGGAPRMVEVDLSEFLGVLTRVTEVVH